MSMFFDPEHDLPPNGATVVLGEHVATYDAGRNWWQLETGAIARPFSRQGQFCARKYAEKLAEQREET